MTGRHISITDVVPNADPAFLLSDRERDERAVEADRRYQAGDFAESEALVIESMSGLRVIRGPADRGYTPMMALMAAQVRDMLDGRERTLCT